MTTRHGGNNPQSSLNILKLRGFSSLQSECSNWFLLPRSNVVCFVPTTNLHNITKVITIHPENANMLLISCSSHFTKNFWLSIQMFQSRPNCLHLTFYFNGVLLVQLSVSSCVLTIQPEESGHIHPVVGEVLYGVEYPKHK